MLEVLNDVTKGKGRIEDTAVLQELALDVSNGSLCGLGKTAPTPVLSTLRYFKDEYTAHVVDGRCPALMCPELIAFYIVPERCRRSCDACVGTCTVEAVHEHPGKRYKIIDQQKCVKCGTCLDACPPEYGAVIKHLPPGEVPG